MGVKDLWSILTPYAERKPIYELRGKTVAIDLAGWVCESLNVVDYFVHPKHHLKNLFFRTCYLIWEEVTPIFVLEGVAPKLKSQVIEKRNELQFRGVKPNKNKGPTKSVNLECDRDGGGGQKSRTRFNHVLKECENLLRVMGIQCIQGPGEAEAYCAFLNQKGLVDGVISQDSDCFAYGAVRVYRNFSVSNQGALAAQGGAVDIYDMQQIRSKMDFGQNKVIAMALLCGCDYCPNGIGGVGRDSVLKLFHKYKDQDILQRLRNWRHENDKYTALEMRLDDKTICTNCGHMGRTQSHTKNGCGICRTQQGCDGSFWKEERLSLKAEVALRHKALADSMFPHEEIICEFLAQPTDLPQLTLKWQKPNMIKFIKEIGELLEWTEIYCFQKFFPILTRWHVQNITRIKQMPSTIIHVTPKEIVKKRIVKGVPSLEIIWQDENNCFKGLIPEEQLVEYQVNNPKGVTNLWTTLEPLYMMETSYADLVTAFLKSKEKPKKVSKKLRKRVDANNPLESLESLNDLIAATEEVAKTVKPKRVAKNRKQSKKGLQMINKFFKEKLETPTKSNTRSSPRLQLLYAQCSTPLTKGCPSDLESDAIDESAFDLSGIINNIVSKTEPAFTLTSHQGKPLRYELSQNITERFLNNHSKYFDDLDILKNKHNLSNSFITSVQQQDVKRISLDDSFDVMVKMGNTKYSNINLLPNEFGKQQECFKMNESNINATNISYFFNSDYQGNDAFEKFMETSLLQSCGNKGNDDGLIILSD